MARGKRSLGEWAFMLGVLLALLGGLLVAFDLVSASTVAIVLMVLGLAVGFLNVTEKETAEFLVATIALLVTGSVRFERLLGATIGGYVDSVLVSVAVFVAPAAVVVSLKSIWELAKK